MHLSDAIPQLISALASVAGNAPMLTAQARELWHESFPEDSRAFVDFYFAHCVRLKDVHTRHDEGRPIAHISLPIYDVVPRVGGASYPLAYVSGACVTPSYRSAGVMRSMMQDLMQAYRHVAGFVLFPADDALRRYYERHLGFRTCSTRIYTDSLADACRVARSAWEDRSVVSTTIPSPDGHALKQSASLCSLPLDTISPSVGADAIVRSADGAPSPLTTANASVGAGSASWEVSADALAEADLDALYGVSHLLMTPEAVCRYHGLIAFWQEHEALYNGIRHSSRQMGNILREYLTMPSSFVEVEYVDRTWRGLCLGRTDSDRLYVDLLLGDAEARRAMLTRLTAELSIATLRIRLPEEEALSLSTAERLLGAMLHPLTPIPLANDSLGHFALVHE